MTLPPLSFPSGRELAGLWRMLQSFQPDAMSIGHLFLYQVDAPVIVSRPDGDESLPLGILKSIAAAEPISVVSLQAKLALDSVLLARVLQILRTSKLLHDNMDAIALTEKGRAAVQAGAKPSAFARGLFHFVEDFSGAPPRYLAVPALAEMVPWETNARQFSLQLLDACIQRSAAWKSRAGFPIDVQGTLAFGDPAAPACTTLPVADWLRVTLVRPMRMPVIFVRGKHWWGFAWNGETQPHKLPSPLFQFDLQNIEDTVGALIHEPGLEAWKSAVTHWMSSHGLPADFGNGIQVTRDKHRLKVSSHDAQGTRALVTAHTAAGEVWLMAGSGPIRSAARMELTSSTSTRKS